MVEDKRQVTPNIKEKTRCKINENIQRIELFKLSNKPSSRATIINLRAENIRLQKSLRELERI